MSSSHDSMENSAEAFNESDSPCIDSQFVDIYFVMNFVKYTDYTLFVMSVFSSILQFYVVRKAIRHIRRGNGDQCLHVFLLSMTFGDLMLTSTCYPLEYITRIGMLTFPRFINITMHFMTWVALSGSSLSLILLNLEKLLYFKYPLRELSNFRSNEIPYTNFVTRKRGGIITVCVWCVCVLFVAGCWYFECFICLDASCRTLNLLPDKKMMYLLFSMSVCIAPTLTSLAVALYILKVVSSHRKKLAEEQALYSNNSQSVSHAIASRLRTFYFIFMTTVFTAATLLPYRIFQIKIVFFDPVIPFADKKTCAAILELWAMSYLISFNAILNPLITVTVLPQYRCRLVKRIMGGSTGETKPTEV